MNPLTNFDTEIWAKYLQIDDFKGIVSGDQINQRFVNGKGFFIANLHPSWLGDSHWVAFFITTDRNEYFDSYWLPPLRNS